MGAKGTVLFDIKELEKLGDNIDKLIEDMPEIMTELTNQETEYLIGDIKEVTPRKTSLLINAWHSKTVTTIKGHYTGLVVNNTEYAVFVEYGHRLVNKNKKTIGYIKGVFMMAEGVHNYKTRRMTANIDSYTKNKLKEYIVVN